MRTRSLLCAAVAAVAAIATAVPAEAGVPQAGGWTVPSCSPVDSDGSLTYTTDNGATLVETTGSMVPVRYQFSIATLATANHLLSGDQSGRLFHSTDAGCTWTPGATLAGMDIPQIEAAPNGSAYVWSINTARLVRVDGTTVTQLRDLPTGGASLVDLAVDRGDAQHLRAVSQDGLVLDSVDGGVTFQPVGDQPDSVYLYDASIDPSDLDHIVLGLLGESILTTFDGAATWQAAELGAPGDRVNAFTVEVSPANGRSVFVQGLNITESDEGHPSQGRHIYRSRNGGQDFTAVVDQHEGVTLTNGTFLQPHPRRGRVLYFVFGSNFGGYGTDLFRYRDRPGGGRLDVEHNSYDDIKAIAFNPVKSRLMYVGLAQEP